jgi:hypothetical protein
MAQKYGKFSLIKCQKRSIFLQKLWKLTAISRFLKKQDFFQTMLFRLWAGSLELPHIQLL